MNPDEKVIYLTFDDGPIPEVTPWVVGLLDKYNVKATFFMVGDNIRKHPDIYQLVIDAGHRIGNHTYNHIRGFEYWSDNYLANADKANELMHTNLFRPPHGHMRWVQYLVLKHYYKIVMWDVVTRDYSTKLRGPQVLANVMRYTRNGSIITFHDSLKSWDNGNLQYALPRSIEFLLEEGYEFGVL
jgi:peptidoglycan/xylan/chitin deacetylase (PgdA/CDA1 family)